MNKGAIQAAAGDPSAFEKLSVGRFSSSSSTNTYTNRPTQLVAAAQEADDDDDDDDGEVLAFLLFPRSFFFDSQFERFDSRRRHERFPRSTRAGFQLRTDCRPVHVTRVSTQHNASKSVSEKKQNKTKQNRK